MQVRVRSLGLAGAIFLACIVSGFVVLLGLDRSTYSLGGLGHEMRTPNAQLSRGEPEPLDGSSTMSRDTVYSVVNRDFEGLDRGLHEENLIRAGGHACFRVLAESTGQVVGLAMFRVRSGVHHAAPPLSVQADKDGTVCLPLGPDKKAIYYCHEEGFGRIILHPAGVDREGSIEALPVYLPPSGSIRGVVSGYTNTGELKVRLQTPSYNLQPSRGLRPSHWWWEYWEADVDPDGHYSIAGLNANTSYVARLVRQASVIDSWEGLISLQPGEARALDWSSSGCIAVHGFIVDQEGNSVSETELWMLRANTPNGRRFSWVDEEASLKVMPDASGAFQLDAVAPGRWLLGPSVKAKECGIVPWGVVLELTGEDPIVEVNLVASRGLAIRGQVIDFDGQPVPGCGVTIEAVPDRESATTDDGGRFEVAALRDLEYVVRAGGRGERFGPSDPVIVRPGSSEVVLRVDAAASVHGALLGVQSKEGFSVLVAPQGSSQPADEAVEYGVEDDGTFRLDGLAQGTYDLVFFGENRHCMLVQGVTIGTARAASLGVEIRPAAHVVILAGSGAEAVVCQVFVDGTWIETCLARDGQPRTLSVPAGRVEVRFASATGYEGSVDFRCDPGQTFEVKVPQ